MPQNAQEWDHRYRQPGYWAGTEPAEFLRDVLPLLPHGTTLDLACGEGRNAVFLAARGWCVLAVDRSRPALEKAEVLAREAGVPALWGAPGRLAARSAHPLTLLETDLESSALPARQFDVVLCFNYLQRSLLSALPRLLRPHGLLVYETYTLAQLQFAKGPRNPEFLLRPDELRVAFPTLEILFYREIVAGKGIASLLARKP